MNQIQRICLFLLASALVFACANSEFSGGVAKSSSSKKDQKKESPKPDPEDTDGGAEGDDESGGDSDLADSTDKGETDETDSTDEGEENVGEDEADAPTGLLEEDGVTSAPVSYDACKALPSAGKRGYGNCNANEVVVIVNDGKAAEMTCCPLAGQNIFSKEQGELFVQRTGFCQENEVLTGMVDTHTPTIVCSKINTKYLELSPRVPSVYVVGNAPGVMGQIAASYNVSDTCICPEGTIAVGGHTASDNKCGEQCVSIRKKN